MSLRAGLLAAWVCALLAAGCVDPAANKKQRDQRCEKNLDCAYGLECVSADEAQLARDGGSATADAGAADARGADAGAPAAADGGTARPAAAAGKNCQFKSFGDCEGDGIGPDGKPQCLAGQRCRDGRCTVQCAAASDCDAGQGCKIGVCQRAAGAPGACNDNRDCPWPQICYYGQCVTRSGVSRCQSDLDCRVQSRCVNGVCQ